MNAIADDSSHYYTAEKLADDCVSQKWDQKQQCFGVMYGVLGTLGYLNVSHTPFANVLCLPPMSPAMVKDEFLSAFFDKRRGLTGMLAGAAVASVLYDRYPCESEKKRRTQEGKAAFEELLKETKPPK
jgi:hypothetical protein